MKINDVLAELQPIECVVAPCATLNPYRKAWIGWQGKDYQFTLKKGGRTLLGYYALPANTTDDPTILDILAHVATECDRGIRCPSPQDWLAAAKAEFPNSQVDLGIAQFEQRYARGLYDRLCLLVGEPMAVKLVACANSSATQSKEVACKPAPSVTPPSSSPAAHSAPPDAKAVASPPPPAAKPSASASRPAPAPKPAKPSAALPPPPPAPAPASVPLPAPSPAKPPDPLSDDCWP